MAKKIVELNKPEITKPLENWAAFVVGVVLLGVCVIFAWTHPEKQDSSTIIRLAASLAGGAFAMFITGTLVVGGTIKGLSIKTGAGIGVWFLIFVFLVLRQEPKNCLVLSELKTDVVALQTKLSGEITVMEEKKDTETDLDKKEQMGKIINEKKKSLDNIGMLLIPHIDDAILSCNNDSFNEQTYLQLKSEFNNYKN